MENQTGGFTDVQSKAEVELGAIITQLSEIMESLRAGDLDVGGPLCMAGADLEQLAAYLEQEGA